MIMIPLIVSRGTCAAEPVWLRLVRVGQAEYDPYSRQTRMLFSFPLLLFRCASNQELVKAAVSVILSPY